MCVCVSYSSPASHIYREEPKGLLMENVAGEALGTDLGKLPGAREGWRSVVGPTSWSTSGSHHWPPPLARKLPGGSLQPCHVPELLTRWISCSGAPFDPFDDMCHHLIC